MRVAPTADPADGWLELVTVGDLSRTALLRLLLRVHTGGHVGRPGVTVRQVRRVELAGTGSLPLNLDGEVCGTLPAMVEILPGALSFLAP